MNLKVSIFKLVSFGVLILVFGYLQYTYVDFIYPTYAYQGYELSFNIFTVIIGNTLFLSLATFLMLQRTTGLVYTLQSLVLFFITTPNFVLVLWGGLPWIVFFGVLLVHTIIALGGASNFRVQAPQLKSGLFLGSTFIFVLLALIPFWLVYGFDLNLRNLLLEEVYEARIDASDKGNIFTSYLYFPMTKVLLPLLIIIFVKNKNWLKVLVCSVVVIYLFLIGAHKSVLATLILALFFSFDASYEKKTAMFLGGMASVFLIGFFLNQFYDFIYIDSLFVRRGLMMPAFLNKVYLDFFQGDYLFWSYSFMSGFLEYPYPTDPAHMIGLEVFDSPLTGANNGFISEGYMNMGPVGLLLSCAVFGIITAVFIFSDLDSRFFGLLVTVIIVFTSSPITVSLISHGMIILLFLVFLMPKNLFKNA